MNFKVTFLSLVIALLLCGQSEAQKLKVISGKLKSLSDHESFNMEYRYDDDLKVGKKSEKQYVSEKVNAKNKKEAGLGDAWAGAWQDNKESGMFFDKLETLFNEVLEDKGVSASRNNTNATCTIIFNVYHMDPGHNVGVSRRPAFVSMTATFVVNGNEVAVIDMKKAPGKGAGGYDFDAAYRLSESFEKTGKTLGKTFINEVY